MDRVKIFIFSDESGTWHDDKDIYVRSWVAITEKSYLTLVNKVHEISDYLGSNELKWKTIAGNKKYISEFNDINFRIFITVSSPVDIKWREKYKITKNFESSIQGFDFGEIDANLAGVVKKKLYDDIKNVLFLNFYERFHIENATKRIEQIIKPSDYDLIYRIDPPQMSIDGWRDILMKISNKRPEFPRSDRDEGIQFADIVAGCFRSLFIKDDRYEEAKEFFIGIKNKLIDKSREIPNPNIIFYKEVNQTLKDNVSAIWKIKKE